MPLIISPPTTAIADVSQKVLGTATPKTTILTITAPATTAIANILDADPTATLGRKINSINNLSAAPIRIAYGRTVAANDFDFIIYGNRQLLDIEWNSELISAMLDSALNTAQTPVINVTTATIILNSSKYIEV